MTWDLNDKYLALSLLHDGELPPADRDAVLARLDLDADWRDTYVALQDTERQLAATLRRRAADPLGAAIEATLERYLRAHRLPADTFPSQVVRAAFPHLADAWLDRVLRAHRLDENFVRKVSDACRIASFQEPLDAQLREAFHAHRVGTAFLERVVGETMGRPQAAVDLPAAPAAPAAPVRTPPAGERSASGRTLAGPPAHVSTTAAVPSTPGRGSSTRRTPAHAMTPAAGVRRPSGPTQAAQAASARVMQMRFIRRFGPALAAAAVLVVAVLGYALIGPRQDNHLVGQHPLAGSPLSAQVYTREGFTGAGPATTVAGLSGYYPLEFLSADRRTLTTGTDAGRLVTLADPETNVPIARVFLDADTTARFYGPGETVPGAGPLSRGGVVLEQGSLVADVDKAGRTFQVLTPAGAPQTFNAVVVHGTRFYVHADAVQAGVDVLEGQVRFIPYQQTNPQEPGAATLATPPPAVDLPSGSRFVRLLADGANRLQRLDPVEMQYRFVPPALMLSGWVQAGGGLERGQLTAGAFFANYAPGAAPAAGAATVFGAPVVLPDGRGLTLVSAGADYRWATLPTAAGANADEEVTPQAIAGAAPVQGRLRYGPVLLPRRQVAVLIGNRLQVFSTIDFQPVWLVDLPADLDLNALSAGPRGMLLLSTSQGLWAYDGATGTPLWSNRTIGEILSGVAATECAEQAYLCAYDSIHARLHLLDADGHLIRTLDLGAADTAAGLAQDIKNWTLHGTPILAGDNCVLVFEDGATAFVNLTTGARRMTAGFGAGERVRFLTLDRRELGLTLLLQSGGARSLNLAAAGAPAPVALPATDVTALAVGPTQAWTVDAAGHLRLWLPAARP